MPRFAVLPHSRALGVRQLRDPLLSSCLRAGLAALVVPQLSIALWWLQGSTAIHFRGWINVEFFLLLSLALLFPSRVLVALMTLDLVLDLVEPIAHLYYFSADNAIAYFPYVLQIPALRLVGYVALALLYVACCACGLRLLLGDRRRPYAREIACCLVLCSVVALGNDVLLSGRLRPLRKALHLMGDADFRHSYYAARMPVTNLAWDLVEYLPKPTKQAAGHADSALSRGLAGVQTSGTRPDIVLVLTESWGLAEDSRLNQYLLKPYRAPSIAQRYSIQTGNIPFEGATTNGETRELCGDFKGRPAGAVSAGLYSNCWPQRLEAAGYNTLSVHGFSSGMYGRNNWYPGLGFQKSYFLHQLQAEGVPVCDGALPGACDAGVAQWIGNTLGQGHATRPPLFVHWVTLGSHLPIARLPDDQHPSDCTAVGIDAQSSLCSWFVHIQTVQSSVAQLALTPGLRPTIFVIVGDHAPPFQNESVRDRFSQSEVPYVILTPIEPPAPVNVTHVDPQKAS